MISKFKDKIKRVIACVLALTMMVPGYVPSLAATDTVDTSQSPALPTLSIEWSEGKYTSEDGSSTDIVEHNPTTNNVKLKVSYFQKEVIETGYAAGDLVITVKGIGNLNRDGLIEALVGADKSGASIKTRDWTYTWNRATDTYTFTNNAAIEPGSVFSGYFELVWSFQSRDDITDYAQQDVQAFMYLPSGECIESEILTFSNKTFCDTYDNDIYSNEIQLNNSGLDELINADADDYIWVQYNVARDMGLYQSRGLKDGPYDYFDPDAENIGTGAIVIGSISSVTGITANKTNAAEDTDSYKITIPTKYYAQHDYHREGYIWVAYPRSYYEDKTVTATLRTYGTYHEYDDNGNTGEVLLASSSAEKPLVGIKLIEPTGNIYNMHKLPYEYYLYNKGSEEAFTTNHYLSSDFNSPGFAMDVEVADDSVYIRQMDGHYRKLNPSEYSIDRVVVPAANTFKTINGFDIPNVEGCLFDFDIYAAQNGETLVLSDENLVTSGVLRAATGQSFDLPEGTTAVSVVYRNVTQSFFDARVHIYTTIDVDDAELPDNEKADFENGDVVNGAFIRLYTSSDGSWFNPNANFYRVTFTGEYADEAEENLKQSDIETYDATLFRSTAVVYLRKTLIKNRVSSITSLSEIIKDGDKYLTDLTLRAGFQTYEEEYPSQFGIYAIIPDYANIYRCETVDDLFDAMTLSGFGFDSDFLKEHCTLEMIPNYKESGGTYVALRFDFSDVTVPHEGTISATFTLKIDSEYYENGDSAILVKSAVDSDSISSGNTYYSYHTVDDGSWYKEYPVSDIDGDGNTSEIMAYSNCTKTWVYAASSQWQQVKKVKTSRTEGDYVITSEEDTREDYPEAEYGTVYSYMLSVRTGNSLLKDAIVYDYLEQGEQAEWQGTFQSVDLSYAKKLGIEPTVYYSTNPNASQDLSSGDWTTGPAEMSAVKVVAIDMRGYEIPASTTLRIVINMIAPNDVSLKNKITENEYFSVGTMVDIATGVETVIDDDLPSNLIQVRLVPGYRRLTITKTDAEDGTLLPDAKFELYVKNTDGSRGELVAYGDTNSKGLLMFKDLPEDQEYILVEVDAPYGYESVGEQIIAFNYANISLSVENERKTGTINLTKVCDLSSRVKIAGAEYTLYDAAGNVIDTQITDSNGELSFTNLVWGEYVVKETVSPAGYQLNETEYPITINRETVETAQIISAVDVQNEVSVRLEKYAADIQDNPLDIALSGAVFELLREVSDGVYKTVGTYVTDKNGHIDLSELIYGNYILRETRAPQGYNMCEEINFTLSPDNTDVVLTAYDSRKPGQIVIVKNDDMGGMVEGAEFTLYADDKTTVIATATTDEAGVAMISGLEWGTYYVKETKAPQGYALDETFYYVNISASKLSVNLAVTNETIKGSVLLTKTDEAGMVIRPSDSDAYDMTAVFSLYTVNGELLREGLTTDENGQVLVEDLPWGSYYFVETKAPAGYGLNTEKIRFSVNYKNCEITQEIEVADPQENRVITLTKRVKADEINFDNGNPSFTFRLEGTDVNGNHHVFYRIVTFTEAYVEDNMDAVGYVTQSVTISGFLAGEYTASEEDSARYYLAELSEYDGTKVGNTIVFDMVNNDSGKATFTNRRYEGQNFSDTGTVANVLNESAKLTGITAEWTADALVLANSTIDRNNLIVTAFYDDGTYEVLANDAYTLSEEVFPNQNGNYTIKVFYEYNDVKKSDTFNVEIYGMVLRIVALTAEPAVEYVSYGETITPDMIQVTAHYNDGSSEVLNAGLWHEDAVVLHSNDLPVLKGAEQQLEFANASSITVEITTETFSGSYGRYGYGTATNSWVYRSSSSGGTQEYTLSGNFVRVFTQCSASIEYYDTLNSPNIAATFVITPNYTSEEIPAAYIWDAETAPNAGSTFSMNISLNPALYSDETELTITAPVTLNIKPKDAYLSYPYDLNKFMRSTFLSATSVVFTDEAIPDDVTVYDVSGDLSESVFAWIDSDKTVHISSGVTGKRIIIHESIAKLFYKMSNLTSIDMTNLYFADDITRMDYMFAGCTSLTTVRGLEKLDTTNVTGMSHLFEGCSNLTNYDFVKNWDVSNVTTMAHMFYQNSGISNVNMLSNWNPSKVTNLQNMFDECTNLTDITGLAGWNVQKVTNMNAMFSDCSSLANVNGLASWKTDALTNTGHMFSGCSVLSDITGLAAWNMSRVTKMSYMFQFCKNLTNVDALADWNTGAVTSMDYMFKGCTVLTNVDGMLSWDVGKLKDLSHMFQSCSSLQHLDGLANWTFGSTGLQMTYMFDGCSSLADISGLTNWNVGEATTFAGMFIQCNDITDVDVLLNWDTSKVKRTSEMFLGCGNLTNVDGLTNWNVSSVTDMGDMFRSCDSLTDLSGLAGWNVSSVTDMGAMFKSCESLTSLSSLATWDVGNVTNMGNMFYGCAELTTLNGLSDWNVGSVTTMYSMFLNCKALTEVYSLSDWDVSSVSQMGSMFNGCDNLTILDLWGWDVSGITSSGITNMFNSSPSIEKIYGQDWTVMNSYIASCSGVFAGCDVLTGGINTTVAASGAHCTPYGGYFTIKNPIELTVDNQCSDVLSIEMPDTVSGGYTTITLTTEDGIILYSFELDGVEIVGTTFTAPEESGTVTISNAKYWTIDAPDTVIVSMPTVVEPGVSEILLDAVDDTKYVQSFEMNGTVIAGNSFVIPAEFGTITIDNVVFGEMIIIESDHNPYLNSQNSVVYGEAEFDGATSLTIELTYQTESTSYDWIYLYDADGNIINNKKYGGSTLKTETITVTGNYVKVVFRTDGSVNGYYGFKAVISPNYE